MLPALRAASSQRGEGTTGVLLFALAVLAVLAAFVAVPDAGSRDGPTIRQMVGQLLLVRMAGRSPSPSFLARVRRGEIGGVILFGDNFGAAGPSGLVVRLQAAARAGGQPPLLIAVDQEGGIVKRLPGAPTLPPNEMRSAAVAEAQGLATARSLRAFGVNLDLAPVLDVGHGGFITPRTFGTTAAAVAVRGSAFARGLARGHVLATAKHFPGLGHATVNTDSAAVKVRVGAGAIRADWAPFRRAIDEGIPVLMMSTAVYPALGSTWPAAFSPNIVSDLRGLGFTGVVVTDALQTPAVNTLMSTARAAVEAVAAGDDIVLAAGPTNRFVDTDGASIPAFDAILTAARTGTVKPATLRAAYQRVLELKRSL